MRMSCGRRDRLLNPQALADTLEVQGWMTSVRLEYGEASVRELVMRNASKLPRLPGSVVCESLGNQAVQLPSLHVCLDLAVPDPRFKLKEPRSKLGEIPRRQVLDPLYELLDFAHEAPLTPGSAWIATARSDRPHPISRPEPSCSHMLIDEDRVSIRVHSDEAGRPRCALIRLLTQLHPLCLQLALADRGRR